MLKRISRSILLSLLVLGALTPSFAAVKAKPKAKPQPAPAASRMYDLFWKRSWAAMEEQYKKGGQNPRDHVLMANAYRLQEKWPQAVAILEAHAGKFPAGIRPYADMTLLLGYEKAGRKKEALDLAERLWKSAPQDLKYYVALAQYRISPGEGPLNRMLQTAGTQDRRIYALSKLVALPGNRTDAALKLLELQPSNKGAAAVLAKQKNLSNTARLALGVYAHLAGDNKRAVELLSPIATGAAGGRKAAYYRAWSLSRLKQNQEALNLWGTLALTGNAWGESSVRRIAALAKDKGMMASCLTVLDRVARERKGNVQARAMLSLVGLLGKEQQKYKDALGNKILQSFPNTTYAFNILWSRGWKNLDAGNAAEAVRLWKLADAPGVSSQRRARILYWLSHAQRAAGRKAEADKTLALLAKTALSHVEAGADMVAPSDMMDGRVRAIRQTLDANGFTGKPIMSYAVKFASSFYGPFREAAGSAPSFGDRKSYQMDYHNRREAIQEALLDVDEGADIIMVKPAMTYLDIVREVRDAIDLPVACYSTSGEYAMVKAGAAKGWIDEDRIICEMAVSAFRAGTDIYLTYFAKELARAMREGRIG